MGRVKLKTGRERSVVRRHPWLFSGAIEIVEGNPESGETITVIGSDGRELARAAFSPQSSIRARIWTWNPAETIDAKFFRRRLRAAIQRRQDRIPADTDAYRLVHGESDGLPGLIVDRYATGLVMQCLSAGIERFRDTLIPILADLTGASWIYERSDAEIRSLEGLAARSEEVYGAVPAGTVEICENGLRFLVDIRRGHKTGFYLDQRSNRARFGRAAAGKTVLDVFCYTGAFAVYALASGATRVFAIDSSGQSLELARENLRLNNLPAEKVDWVQADAFHELRKCRDRGQSFDRIVLDPPKFASTPAQVQRASRGYKDLNLLVLKLLSHGGKLFTFSCSGSIGPELFQKIVAGAALDAGVDPQILAPLAQGADHPVAIHFPQGAYLKGLVLQHGLLA